MKNEKVVFLDSSRNTSTYTQRELPRLMEQIRDYSINELNQLFIAMLDDADDVFFDLADKAGSNSDQSLFFNSMRELRIVRKRVEAVFSQELNNNFLNLQSIKKLIEENNVEQYPIDALSLVQEDELEENLALNSMAAKANAVHKSGLHQIVTRFDTLLANLRIDKSNNPLSPHLICESFRTASEPLELDIKARLVMFKLFERLVVANLGRLYEGVNNFLIDNGVLPDLAVFGKAYKNRYIQKRNTAQQSVREEQDADEQSTDPDAESDFLGALKALLVAQKTADHTVAKPQALVDKGQLVHALSTIQDDAQKQSIVSNTPVPMADLRGQLASVLPILGPVTSHNIGKTNDDIIDIISLLFDFILDDKNLPDVFKALIGRLQIPILKVALIDETFFSKGNHPARKLLNEMAHAGVGWTVDAENSSFGIRAKVEKIVTKILDEFDDDTNLFAEALLEFHEFMESHRNRTTLLERRLEEAEEGKAKTETAKIKAKEALIKAVGNHQLPESVSTIIFDAWQSVMLLTYLREGDDSDAWDEDLQIIDNLMASLVPVKTMQAKQLLEARLPELIQSIKSGLDTVGYGEFESLQFFKELEKIHAKVLNGEPVLIVLARKVETISRTTPSYTYQDAPIPSLEELAQELFELEQENETKAELADAGLDMDNLNKTVSTDDIEAINYRESGSYFDSSLMDNGSLHEDDETMLLVESLLAGSWFELNIDHKPSRVKLAAVISSIGKYIFVNNTGKKIAEYNKLELALTFRRGNITQLDDGALFERALKSIVSNLRSQKQYLEDGL